MTEPNHFKDWYKRGNGIPDGVKMDLQLDDLHYIAKRHHPDDEFVQAYRTRAFIVFFVGNCSRKSGTNGQWSTYQGAIQKWWDRIASLERAMAKKVSILRAHPDTVRAKKKLSLSLGELVFLHTPTYAPFLPKQNKKDGWHSVGLSLSSWLESAHIKGEETYVASQHVRLTHFHKPGPEAKDRTLFSEELFSTFKKR